MDRSEFVIKIGENIEQVTGVKLNFREKGTVPEEEWIAENPKGDLLLRTAEQTQKLDVVKRKRIFLRSPVKQSEITCRMIRCEETKTALSSYDEGRMKQELFLCKTHHEILANRVSKRCAQENLTVDLTSFKDENCIGYTSLIAALEKAFMHLKSKRLPRSVTVNSLLAEIFLNARNVLIITNALLNDFEGIIVNACLKILACILEDPKRVENLRRLFINVTFLALGFYGIVYSWVSVSLENPSAKIGFGLAILLLLLVVTLGSGDVSLMFLVLGLLIPCAVSFIGSGLYNWNAPYTAKETADL